MRPTGLASGVYAGSVDYGIYCGEWCIGRIYETRTGPEELRWFWALHAPGGRETIRASKSTEVTNSARSCPRAGPPALRRVKQQIAESLGGLRLCLKGAY